MELGKQLVSAGKSRLRRPRARSGGSAPPPQAPLSPLPPKAATQFSESSYVNNAEPAPTVEEIERRIRAELTAELAAERTRLESERSLLARLAFEAKQARDRQRKDLADWSARLRKEEARLQREKLAIVAKRRAARLATSDLATQRKAWQTSYAAEQTRLQQIRSETECLRKQADDRLQAVEIQARALEADIAAKRRFLLELDAAAERRRATIPDTLPTEPSGLLASLGDPTANGFGPPSQRPAARSWEDAASEIVAFAECVLDAEARLRDERRRWETIERHLEREREQLAESRVLLERQKSDLEWRKQRLANAELAFQRNKLQIERALDARELALRSRDTLAREDSDRSLEHWRAERDHLRRTIASMRAEIEHLAAALVLDVESKGKSAESRGAA